MTDTQDLRGRFGTVALVLQGGGALGAYQCGVYEALSRAGCEPDWLSGISIGSINAAIIAGNPPGRRVEALRRFWEQVTEPFAWPAPELGDDARRLFNSASASHSLIAGQPGFFVPRIPPAIVRPHGAVGANSVYDTSPLKSTLETLVDFERVNRGEPRLSLGAVNVRSGNFAYFDSALQRIGPLHVMASGALPPGFPPIEIDGEMYWDGGLVSNTPLVHVLDGDMANDTLVFQLDLFNARGEVPGDLMEAEERRKHIVFSSRTRLNTDLFRERHRLQQAIATLHDRLPEEVRQEEAVKRVAALGRSYAVAIVHLIYRRRSYEGQAIDYDFSRAAMEEHWRAGFDDATRTIGQPHWLQPFDAAEGIKVFDLTRV
ncbi:MAG: patatin-like phospholipase family protein [Hyphomicrobiaceae bacterium]